MVLRDRLFDSVDQRVPALFFSWSALGALRTTVSTSSFFGSGVFRAGTRGTPAARASLVTTSGTIVHTTSTAGMGYGRMGSTGAAGRTGGGRGEEQGVRPSPRRHKQQQQQEEMWVVGAYVILCGSVDLYVLER